MKVEIDEYELGFSVNLFPETLEESVKLTRMALQSTAEYHVHENGTPQAQIELPRLSPLRRTSIVRKPRRNL